MAALSYATFAVVSKPLVEKYGALPIAIRAGAIGTVMFLPLLSRNFIAQVSAMTWTGWLSVLYLSILVTVICVIGGILFLGETVSIFTVTGGAALLIAIALATRSQLPK